MALVIIFIYLVILSTISTSSGTSDGGRRFTNVAIAVLQPEAPGKIQKI